jgi:hypothetical protein
LWPQRLAGVVTIWWWQRLAGALTDECGEYLHHGGVVFCGIAGDPLKGVDAADAHVELIRAELLNGLGEAVGHLALLGQLMGATLPLISLLRITPQEVEIQGGKDQRPTGNQARAQCQQSSPGII